MSALVPSEVRKWVLSRGDSALTTKDLVDLVMAVDADNEARHAESLQLLRDHIADAEVRDKRIAVLERQVIELDLWRKDQAQNCAERVKRLIHEEHEKRHGAYVATLGADDDDSDFHDRILWFLASSTGKILLVVFGVVLGIIFNMLLYGRL